MTGCHFFLPCYDSDVLSPQGIAVKQCRLQVSLVACSASGTCLICWPVNERSRAGRRTWHLRDVAKERQCFVSAAWPVSLHCPSDFLLEDFTAQNLTQALEHARSTRNVTFFPFRNQLKWKESRSRCAIVFLYTNKLIQS